MAEGLFDRFGRRHHNLRIGVTDRCNIRCRYCMPEEVEFLSREHLLTFEEIERFARVATRLGVDKIRLTGGEPLMRRDIHALVRRLVNIPGVIDIGMTTNGILLADHAQDLHDAGLSRLNVSLDSLDRVRFQRIARRDGLDRVLAGLEKARQVGFERIKVNTVAMKGFTEPDVVPLARYCRDRGFEIRFIEFMPLDADEGWTSSSVLTADEILALLDESGMPARPRPGGDPSAPASEYEFEDGGSLGIIASVSKPFCGTCNRIRITADGKFRNCLFALDEVDIKAAMRTGASDDELAQLVRESVHDKWAGHLINRIEFQRPPRTMHTIGG